MYPRLAGARAPTVPREGCIVHCAVCAYVVMYQAADPAVEVLGKRCDIGIPARERFSFFEVHGGADARQHVSTPARRHVSTPARQHVSANKNASRFLFVLPCCRAAVHHHLQNTRMHGPPTNHPTNQPSNPATNQPRNSRHNLGPRTQKKISLRCTPNWAYDKPH